MKFDAIAGFLKTSAIRRRWYFSGSGSNWSHNWLVVLDAQGQLSGMSIGYSE